MNENPERRSRDEPYWAKPITKLEVGEVPPGATNLVEGRRVTSPMQGFGQLWQKTYRARLAGASVSPAEVIRTWKQNFPRFWGAGRMFSFYAPLAGLAPGDVALINAGAGGVKLSTGVFIVYADDESFTFMTPEGHTFAGWITFSAAREDGDTVVQAQVLIRASDPLTELAMPLGLHRFEDRTWEGTLRSIAAHFGVENASVERSIVCVDRRRQWRHAGNIWKNAGLHSAIHVATAPVRWARKALRGPAR